MSGKRSEKLNSEFKKNIYEILSRKVKNPQLTEMFSVTEVETDPELSTAKVYVSVYSKDAEKAAATMDAIRQSAGYVRTQLSKSMHIRTVPQLIFTEDRSMSYGDKIDRILERIGVETDGK